MIHLMRWVLIAGTVLVICAPAARSQDQPSPDAKGMQIADARLGKSVQERMIADEATAFPLNTKAYLWLKVSGGSGDSLTVTWKHGEKTYPTQLLIGGSPWRTWASKTLNASGEWSVSVSNQSGSVLKEITFTVE